MFRSTFSGFTIARNAMQASQYALEVTGQNIANINTPVYTRQRLDQVSIGSTNSGYNSHPAARIGFGVQMTGISQIRDPALDRQFRNQITKLGTSDAVQDTFNKLGNIFDETESEGVRQAISDVMSSIKDYSLNPGNQEYDSIVRSRLQVLVNEIHTKASGLSDLREELETGTEEVTIPQLNTILQDIDKLNKSIWNSQVVGNPALELQDQRNALIDQLAGFLPIDVTYTSHPIASGASLTGIQITYKPNDGTDPIPLVTYDNDGSQVGSFGFNANDPVTNLASMSITSATDPAVTSDITNSIADGTLKGVLTSLNGDGNLTAAGNDLRGIAYYEKTLDAFASTFATLFNQLNTTDNNGNPIAGTGDLFETTDPTGQFSASSIKIADGWMEGTTSLTTTTDPAGGSTANDNLHRINEAIEADREFIIAGSTVPYYTGSFSKAYTNSETILGIDSKTNTSTMSNDLSVLKQTATARDSVSGISLDEEGMNLLHYQRSYSAAARLMTTLDEALDILINKTGIVGR